MDDCLILEASNSVGTVHHPISEVINSSHLNSSPLIARARAVGVIYEFAQPDVVENEDERSKTVAKSKESY